ncbi:MAG: DUF4873 domain-containing protein [Mycobacterium sp.]
MTATDAPYDVAVIGTGCTGVKLREAGITNVVRLETADEVISSVFDEAAHAWTLRTHGGESYRARIVIASGTCAEGPDGLPPYLGVAMHGVPNQFLLTGPDVDRQLDYVLECLRLMAHTGSTRIEVRRSTQRVFSDRSRAKPRPSSASYWRRMRKRIRAAFDLSSGIGVSDEVYDGPATVTIGGDEHAVRVRMTGNIDPIDGRYHWQGTVFASLPNDDFKKPVTVTVGERTVQARITERTPWGTYSVAGVGEPPFALDDVELVVPSP